MVKKVLVLVLLAGMMIFTQCSGDLVEPLVDDEEYNFISEGRNGGRIDSNVGLYGDLIICLRDVYGIPEYVEMDGEHGVSFYPQPIKIDENTLEPLQINGVYQTFELDSEGDVVPESGYIVKEVEFGRLNIVRAPQSVLNSALDEAIAGLQQNGVTKYMTDASGRLVAIVGEEDWLVNYDAEEAGTPEEYNDKTIDSPRENIAIYQDLMSNQFGGKLFFLLGKGINKTDLLNIAYGASAAGADKTGIMTVDEFAYMNNWLLDLPENNSLGIPDELGRFYFNYSNFTYSREAVYGDKYVRITVLNPEGTWEDTYESLLDVTPWTDPAKVVRYGTDFNRNITGFAQAADDAVQVLEFIHSSDLVVYSPYFTADGFVSPIP